MNSNTKIKIVATIAAPMLAVGLSACGAVDAALLEGSASDGATTASYSKDLYLQDGDPQYVGVSPDPSGSLSLSDGDITWALSVQSLVAEALAARLWPLPADDAGYSSGAPGVGELHLIYMPVASSSGEWRGDKSSVEVTIPGVPTLLPEPQPDQEEDVPGRHGKGVAWSAAKDVYVAAYNAAAVEAQLAAEKIANFPVEEQDSDVYGSVIRLAERMGGPGTILVLSDLKDMNSSTATKDLSPFKVLAVQACKGEPSSCTAAAQAFSAFVTAAGGPSPTITGHEAARQIINDLITQGGQP